MPDIVTVDLSKKELEIMPSEDIRLDVHWLILSDNRIRRIPKAISGLKQLSRLALNDNRLAEVCPELGDCVGLTWMDLTRNRLSVLPKELGRLTRVSGLGLSENEFDEVPECVYRMRNLKKFGFFSNRIRFLSPEIRNLRNLVKLDLSNNRLEFIPDEFCTLVNLSWLNLSNNRLTHLPAAINSLWRLEELGLGMNQLVELPDMSNLNNLRVLPIFKNRLRSIHPSLLYLKAIEKLDFSDNEIKDFPHEAVQNPSLRYLNLRNNQLEYISPFFFNEVTTEVTLIDVSENRLKCIPFKFFKAFPQLVVIRLSGNPFETSESKLENNHSLMQICFTKLLSEKHRIDTWVNRIFKTKHVCDECKKEFVVVPCFSYAISCLDQDTRFVVEKMLCSIKCVRLCEHEAMLYRQQINDED